MICFEEIMRNTMVCGMLRHCKFYYLILIAPLNLTTVKLKIVVLLIMPWIYHGNLRLAQMRLLFAFENNPLKNLYVFLLICTFLVANFLIIGKAVLKDLFTNMDQKEKSITTAQFIYNLKFLKYGIV